MIRVRITDGDDRREVELTSDRVVAGRSPECDLRLASTGVSREHAEIVRAGGTWFVCDLGSRNGTTLNGEPVERAAIAPGDEIRLGDGVLIEVLEPGPAKGPGRARPEAARPAAGDPEDREVRAPAAGRLPPWREWRWWLTPVNRAGEPIALQKAILTVGRDEGVGLFLDDASISRMHARLDVDGARLKVTDLKSANGTCVNDAPVTASPLTDGDRVRFGDVEFEVGREEGMAWGGLLRALVLPAAVLVIGIMAAAVIGRVLEAEQGRRALGQFRQGATQMLRLGIEASRRGENDVARGFFAHAAEEYVFSGLAPKNADPARPERLLRDLARGLPPELQDFDFAAALDSSAVRHDEADLEALTLRQYVERKLRAYCADLGQDPELPPEFVAQVWQDVEDFQRFPGSMRQMLARARRIQPRINEVLAREKLSPSVGYIAWVESELDPMKLSRAKALGLWQLMSPTARQYGLHTNETDHTRDERTDVEKSTRAAARYISEMLKDQGPEYYMLVLASYNGGPNALRAAKQKVDDPNLRSTQKYWYLVRKGYLARETSEYVPKIMAVRLIAESPARFGF
jgi:pSer/pThr/pTyr-binding forkhead associated (FHA) protein